MTLIIRALIASLIAVVTLSIVPEAAARTYAAERFDSRIRILPNGSLEVVETVVFRSRVSSSTSIANFRGDGPTTSRS